MKTQTKNTKKEWTLKQRLTSEYTRWENQKGRVNMADSLFFSYKDLCFSAELLINCSNPRLECIATTQPKIVGNRCITEWKSESFNIDLNDDMKNNFYNWVEQTADIYFTVKDLELKHAVGI